MSLRMNLTQNPFSSSYSTPSKRHPIYILYTRETLYPRIPSSLRVNLCILSLHIFPCLFLQKTELTLMSLSKIIPHDIT
ncbi:hypothetical protein I7I48_04696 [Histoplasma ohiense]|nr:hypothetical protein I7I48_04696 [Histoplasma ohiense (nom. inval.)]